MTQWFHHELLRRPLTWDQAMRLHGEMTAWFFSFYGDKKFTGKESWGGDPHAQREAKKAKS